jgi:hypothetical protein
MTTNDLVQTIVTVLAPFVGSTMARSATLAHCQKLGITGERVSAEQIEALLVKLGGGLNIFLGRDRSSAVIADVRRSLAGLEAAER